MENQIFLYKPKLFRYIIGIYFFFIPIFLYLDPLQISPDRREIYIIGRLATIFIFLLTFIHSFWGQKHWHALIFYIGLLFHAVFGQFFLPCYYLAYMEIIIPTAMFIPLKSEKQFYVVTFIGYVAMIYAIVTSGQNYSSDPSVIKRFHVDICSAVSIMTFLAVLGYNFVTKVTKEKDILSAKFLDIGKNTSSIIHDFKGLLGTPLLYSELLETEVSKFDCKTKDIVLTLNKELKVLKDYINKVNQLNALTSTPEIFNLESLITDVSVLVKPQSDIFDISVENGDVDILFYKNLMLKVLYNLIINSIEVKSVNQKIKINISYSPLDKVICFTDNGVGASSETLKRINLGHSVVSSKKTGSGIGILLARELLMNHGAKINFQNKKESSGIRICITLPNF